MLTATAAQSLDSLLIRWELQNGVLTLSFCFHMLAGIIYNLYKKGKLNAWFLNVFLAI